MTTLATLLDEHSNTQLQQLYQAEHAKAVATKRAAEIEELVRTQNDELLLGEPAQRNAGYAIMAHGKPCYNAWVSGRLGKSTDPENIFEDYRAGDTSGRWQGYVARAEIDPPKRNR